MDVAGLDKLGTGALSRQELPPGPAQRRSHIVVVRRCAVMAWHLILMHWAGLIG